MIAGIEIDGGDELEAMLSKLSDREFAASVARSAVRSGMKVLRKAAIRASPGLVKLEYSQKLLSRTAQATGLVGLGANGYRASLKRPHGIYLELGTPYIAARGFARSAFSQASPKARARMIAVAKFRIEKAIEKKE